MSEDSDVMDVREAARYLKLNEQTARRLARSNQLPAFRVGGSWRFKKDALDSWAKAQMDSQSTKSVLVIDDEELMVDMVRRALVKEGFEVRVALGGAEALEIMRTHVPDLVFLDLAMPEMDGPSILREIRLRHGAVPVVIFTGHPNGELMERAMEYTPVTLLAKPATPQRIRDTAKAAATGRLRL